LPAKQFDLLAYFANNAERVVTNDELMEAVWPDRIVEDANLTHSLTCCAAACAPRGLPRRSSSLHRARAIAALQQYAQQLHATLCLVALGRRRAAGGTRHSGA